MSVSKESLQLANDKLMQYKYEYDVLMKPSITDGLYDSLFKQLESDIRENPELRPHNCILDVVGMINTFDTKPHAAPMLSLDNSLDEADLESWLSQFDDDTEYHLEPKYDGLALSIEYSETTGALVTGLTRGDGRNGEDVTLNVKAIDNIPASVHCGGTIVRGEAVIPLKAFQEFNEKRAEQGLDTFANPRNAAAGAMRLKDPKESAQRPLMFMAYGLAMNDELSMEDQSLYLESLGFTTATSMGLGKTVVGAKKVLEFIAELGAKRQTLPFEIDGVVIKLNSADLRAELGSTRRAPRWARAFKFPPNEVVTSLREVIYQVGRSGKITPVAKVVPIEVGGVTVSSITLHNFNEIARLKLYHGARVVIRRAGDVIPQLVAVKPPANPKEVQKYIVPPTTCPCCDTPLIQPEGIVDHFCPNVSCGDRLQRWLEYFVSRDIMDIQGCGPSAITVLIVSGLVKQPFDLYSLTKEDLRDKAMFGPTSSDNLLHSIELSKTTTLSRLIASLGIPGLGVATAKKFAHMFKDIRDIMANEDRWVNIEDVGEVLVAEMKRFFKDNLWLIESMEKIPFKEDQFTISDELWAKSYVITGSFLGYARSDIEMMIGRKGGFVKSTVNKKTTAVLVGDNPGSKATKAEKLNVPIITDGSDEFKAIMSPSPKPIFYSLRAECQADVDKLLELLNEVNPRHETFVNRELDRGEWELEILTRLTLEELRALIRTIDDSHVMLQTTRPVPLVDNDLSRDWNIS